MMARNFLGRILHVAYPAIVFAIAMLVWSSSNLAEVARLTPPPVNEGFNFFWNPTLSNLQTCSGKPDSKIKFKHSCSAGSNSPSQQQFSTK